MKKLGKGMFKDTARVDQPEGTMRDALNANLNIKKGSISNEWGTYEYPNNAGFRVLGRTVLDDDVIVMFGQAVNVVDNETVYTDQIRTLNTRNQEVLVLYENDLLNFQQTHPIVATNRKNQAGDYIVYFTDGYKEEAELYTAFEYVNTYNPPRVINVTRQRAFRLRGGLVDQLYNNTNSFYKLNLIPRIGTHSSFDSARVLSGGNLYAAAYYLALAYTDRDGVETNYFVLSNPVYIVPNSENITPTNSFIGAEGGTKCNKTIQWVVDTPIDIDYELLQPAVIKLQKTAMTAEKLKPVAMNKGYETIVTYSGNEDSQSIAVEDIIVDDVNYITADTISQLDNRLYLGNVSSNKDIGFQPFAQNIQLEAVVEEAEAFSPRLYDTFALNQGYAALIQEWHADVPQQFKNEYQDLQTGNISYAPTGNINYQYQELLNNLLLDPLGNTRKGYRDPNFYFQRKSFRRGEVYAFYISFILNDGTETYAYHIPGREPRCIPVPATQQTTYEYAQYRKVTFSFDDYDFSFGGSGVASQHELVFLYVPPLGQGNSPVGYPNAGYYRPAGWTNDATLVNQFNANSLPETISVTGATYISLTLNSADDFGASYNQTTVFNAMEAWLLSNGPTLGATEGWDEIVGEEISSQTPAILETEVSISILSDDDVCENDALSKNPAATKLAFGFLPTEALEQYDDIRLFNVLDTGNKIDPELSGNMGYWANENEFYPSTRDFTFGDVTTEGVAVLDDAQGIYGERVRHHRMPGNLSDEFSYIERSSEHPVNNSNGNTHGWFEELGYRPLEGDRLRTIRGIGGDGTMALDENVRLLGVRLNNLKIPRGILEQIQGYKIYYAKRDEKDKTILGQSIAVPGHPRAASVNKQSLEEAVTGPFTKAFYMYGGLDHTDNTTVETYGKWKSTIEGERRYYSHPVFKFHDLHQLRKRSDMSAATHIQCQYGVIFRMYSGGPGVFVPPCAPDKVWDAVIDFDESELSTSFNDGVPDYIIRNSDNNLDPWDAHSTTFPSLGWVSPEMQNTVDFYWHDPKNQLGKKSIDKKMFGETRILDISDVQEGVINYGFIGDDDGEIVGQGVDGGANDNTGVSIAKRARKYRRGEDLSQPANGDFEGKAEQFLAIKAKEARVRAWYTSAMIGTAYISPSIALSSPTVVKGGSYKAVSAFLDGDYLVTSGASALNRFYQEGNFDDNQLTLMLDPNSKILLHGRENHETSDSTSFKGAQILYNLAGETAHAFGLVSGLPALRGHAPFDNLTQVGSNGDRAGLVRWGEALNWLYPDAFKDTVPYEYQLYGFNTGSQFHYLANASGQDGEMYAPRNYQGLRYRMSPTNHIMGLPMAWLLNVCAIRRNVFSPFDQQNLVWTGYFNRIRNANLTTGEADDGYYTRNYYEGAQSREIFGGDTYITKTSFRSTSQSYGHSYWRANRWYGDPVGASEEYTQGGVVIENASNLINIAFNTTDFFGRRRFQSDLPANLDPLSAGLYIADRFGTTQGAPIWNATPDYLQIGVNSGAADSRYDMAQKFVNVVADSHNWVKGNVNPVSTVFSFYVESDDLLEWRHVDDVERGEKTKVFDYHTGHSVIFNPPYDDFTKPDKILYEDHLSALQNVKVTSPLNVFGELSKVQTFPNRVVRSDVDSGSISDGYRKFRALEYKDIPTHRGQIKNLFDLNGNLYIHTERSLFVTKGKEELQLDAVTAFIGSGNIFVQDPDEAMQADAGYAGTASRHAHITTVYGHFYVNYRDRKVYSVSGQGVADITSGMETWLRDNMPFALEQFGINLDSENARENGFFVDATTGVNVPIGFTLGYDPLFKRILITKHEPIPTQQFFEDFYAGNIVVINDIPELISGCADLDVIQTNARVPIPEQVNFKANNPVYCGPIWFGNPVYFTQSSWTISYYPELKVWGSRHSYAPNLYTNTSEYLVSFAGDRSWEHTNKNNPGRFYGELYNFEVEFIDNTAAAEAKLFSNMFYWAESFLPDQNSISEQFRVSNPVFDEFYAYNSTQITGLPITINYLNNARLVDRIWYVNEIRDLSIQQQLTEGELITGTENVAGNITTEVTVHPQATTMFTEEGVVNNNYVNLNKEWFNRRKMIDHYLGVRLIKDNTNRNLVHLYAVGTKFRKSFR